jgi:hypothetical protein
MGICLGKNRYFSGLIFEEGAFASAALKAVFAGAAD